MITFEELLEINSKDLDQIREFSLYYIFKGELFYQRFIIIPDDVLDLVDTIEEQLDQFITFVQKATDKDVGRENVLIQLYTKEEAEAEEL